MEFKQLEIFMSVVEHKSFSIAAVSLGVSQPTVSFQIKQLEEELDLPLLIRSTRELRVTPEGEELYEKAKRILADRDDLMKNLGKDRRDNLHLGVSTIGGIYLLPRVTRPFLEVHPDVMLSIRESNSERTIRAVADCQADVGIVGMKKDEEQCSYRAVFRDEFVYVAPNTPEWQAALDAAEDPKDLLRRPFLVREQGSGIRKHVEELICSMGGHMDEIRMAAAVNDVETLKNLVRAGVGGTIVSKIAVEEEVASGQLLIRTLEPYERRFRHLYLVWNRRVTLPGYVKDFLKIATEALKQDE